MFEGDDFDPSQLISYSNKAVIDRFFPDSGLESKTR